MKGKQHAPIVRTADFRFYEELNDFLPEQCRKRFLSYDFIGTPSIKDTIEAIGVPHAEIDLILVNGKSVGYDYLMRGGERVSVYPVFESFDITPVLHLRLKPLRDIKFVVDVNLGKLAYKLRLLGFDTLYKNDFIDSEIVKISLREKRIILTRDKGILKYTDVTHGYWLRSNDINKQVGEVVRRLQLAKDFRPFTRCSNCNGMLHPIDKPLLKDRLPGDTLQFFDVFMECRDCEQIYWRGSHYEKICRWIDELQGSKK